MWKLAESVILNHSDTNKWGFMHQKNACSPCLWCCRNPLGGHSCWTESSERSPTSHRWRSRNLKEGLHQQWSWLHLQSKINLASDNEFYNVMPLFHAFPFQEENTNTVIVTWHLLNAAELSNSLQTTTNQPFLCNKALTLRRIYDPNTLNCGNSF